MVYGPVAHAVSGVNALNTSAGDIYRLINGSEKAVPDTSFWAFADVRDGVSSSLSKISTAPLTTTLQSLKLTFWPLRSHRPPDSDT